ncbi:DUF3662 and FHA domain-containing protein [Corynebacterium gerontici]|uniref:FHA domain-containing protein FhaA n=1 Tax=Corynebacterium gerontici TaxID=2079234 RepID=A0A3G6J2P5_9CORY|nr:DUF3662 and FHA domain-containing protein [Corynebacterium gerontici]AZA10374.1 FHA domain-containing protein FhaA [Corynebacterium gerontici]
MSLMGKIAKLDSAMQRGLDNSFAFVFGGRVVPAEIEELLKQAAEDETVHTYEGTIEAPNVFRIEVSAKDYSNLQQEHPRLPENFADQLARYYRNQGWQPAGPITVAVALDKGLRTGQLRASTESTAAGGFMGFAQQMAPRRKPAADTPAHHQQPESEAAVEAHPQQPSTQYMSAAPEHDPNVPMGEPETSASGLTMTLLLQDGSSRTYLVRIGSNIIGRSNDADLRLPDTGVSRQHAEIEWNGEDAVLTDLHSTNGTTVNGTPVENWLLADGDVITVGHSHIEVRIVDAQP